MKYASFAQIRLALSEGTITCVALVEHYLHNIEQQAALNAFLSVYAAEARARAAEIDAKIAAGTARRLAGMVVGIKDVLTYADHPLQAGSRILDGFQSCYTATCVQRLLDEDAIIIGRQNCDEFGMGSSSQNPHFGAVRNALDTDRTAGGSSGGSAVAVQADMCLISLGSDTGGSVRQPAAFCGIVGLKPSYGRISRHGLVAYASSFDCVGIMAREVADVALVLEIIAGADAHDSTSHTAPVPTYTQALSPTQPYKIAHLRESFSADVSPAVRTATQAMLDRLVQQGHQVAAIDFPLLAYLLPTYYVLTTAEASSNLARYDGVRYGYRSDTAQDLTELYTQTRSEAFGTEVQRRILLGTFVLSADYYDAYYTQAQRVRRQLVEAVEAIFEEYDFLVMPTTPRVAFRLDAPRASAIELYLEDIFTVLANLTAIPAISIPAGHSPEGLPIGFQILAPNLAEEKLLALSAALMQGFVFSEK